MYELEMKYSRCATCESRYHDDGVGHPYHSKTTATGSRLCSSDEELRAAVAEALSGEFGRWSLLTVKRLER